MRQLLGHTVEYGELLILLFGERRLAERRHAQYRLYERLLVGHNVSHALLLLLLLLMLLLLLLVLLLLLLLELLLLLHEERGRNADTAVGVDH